METAASNTPQQTNGVIKPVMDGKRRKFSEQFKRTIAGRIRKGEVAHQLGEKLGISPSALRRWALQAGATHRGGAKVKKPPSKPAKKTRKEWAGPGTSLYSTQTKRKALERIAAGQSVRSVSKAMKLGPSALYYWRAQEAKQGKPAAAPKRAPGLDTASIAAKDAVAFLKHARTEAQAMLTRGDIKEFDQAHLLSMMALNSLLKG